MRDIPLTVCGFNPRWVPGILQVHSERGHVYTRGEFACYVQDKGGGKKLEREVRVGSPCFARLACQPSVPGPPWPATFRALGFPFFLFHSHLTLSLVFPTVSVVQLTSPDSSQTALRHSVNRCAMALIQCTMELRELRECLFRGILHIYIFMGLFAFEIEIWGHLEVLGINIDAKLWHASGVTKCFNLGIIIFNLLIYKFEKNWYSNPVY